MHLPPLNLTHLRCLTDDTGIVQHAKFSVGDPKTGYTTDDNARALVVAARLSRNNEVLDLVHTYLHFLLYVQREDGTFHNLVGYDRHFLDEIGSEDTLGRAIWGCGEVIAADLPPNLQRTAEYIIERALQHIPRLRSMRGWANSLLGLIPYYRATRRPDAFHMIQELTTRLLAKYEQHASPSWRWFEDILTYDLARLPQALLESYGLLKESRILEVAEEALAFLTEVLFLKPDGEMGNKAVLAPVGNRGWYPRGGTRALYDQQPVDAGCLVEAYAAAYQHTNHRRYRDLAQKAFLWFLGRNLKREPVYDPATGGCYDGITENGVNLNQGAEATIAYLLARLAMEEIQKKA
ncbi:MAG: glycosyltransferase [Armatimonadota bacterium]|nr:glycosyltransferase [Armatimonadota bacterium]MDR5703383.1 glycosyltransferase [Armatimonadota bacterium]